MKKVSLAKILVLTGVLSSTVLISNPVQAKPEISQLDINTIENSDFGYTSSMTFSEVISYIENNNGFIDKNFVDLCKTIIELKDTGMNNNQILELIENKTTYSLYDTWGKLTDMEKLYVTLYPKDALIVQSNANKASSSTFSIYGYNGNGDVTDAYRHGYWNALNARDVGTYKASLFATAHESLSEEELKKVSNGFTGEQHREMDLHNNEVGRNVIKWNDLFVSDNTLSNRIKEQISKGNMIILVK